MARRIHDDALGVSGAETIIGAGVIVHGNLTGESDMFIDGQLEGSIKTAGDITIGVNARVKAGLEANNVTVAGTLIGNIDAAGETTIRESGNVHGDITSAGLAIASGGVFIGRSTMEAPASALERTDPDFTPKTKRPATIKQAEDKTEKEDREA